MLPFLSTVDHRIGPSPLPFEERRVLHRSSPERLRFDLPASATPFLNLSDLPPLQPAPAARPSRLRIWLGEMLIAWGERLAMPAQAR